MNLVAEVCLEISIGGLRSSQEFVVVSSLVEECILGIDFLVKHQIDLDFDRRIVKGPSFGAVEMSNKIDLSKGRNSNFYVTCPIHSEFCFEKLTSQNSSDLGDNDDWECRGVVPDYRNTPVFELPLAKDDFVELIHEFKDLFCSVPGVAKVDPFQIITGNGGAVRTPPRIVPQAYQEEVSLQIDEMLRKDIIRISCSSWLSPPVMVKKKDGSLRFCIDYRGLNKVTQKDAYPLPLPDQAQNKLHGMKYFTKLDLNSGYWQIPVRECDKEKTAFSPGPGMGLYEFNVLPFGLTGGPSSFQRIMDKVLRGLERFKDNFIDDILIFSQDKISHIAALREVFERLRMYNLTLRGKKCEIGRNKVTYLGHTFSSRGMEPDVSKLDSIGNWVSPSCEKEVKQFLGLASYYRRYIQNFASIAEPLNRLLRTDVVFTWGDQEETAFQRLKEILISSPVLQCPDFSKRFQLYTDASGTGLGAVLEQDGHHRRRNPPGYPAMAGRPRVNAGYYPV